MTAPAPTPPCPTCGYLKTHHVIHHRGFTVSERLFCAACEPANNVIPRSTLERALFAADCARARAANAPRGDDAA